MAPDAPKLLADLLEAARTIQRLCEGMDLDGFLKTRAVRDATHWNFVVVGEAMTLLVRADAQAAASIREYRRIIAFRNQLVHGYGVIDPRITWSIIVTKLPLLIEDVERLLPA